MTLAKITHIQKRRKLSELFERGGDVRFNEDGVNTGDPTPNDIVVYVRPPNPFERDMAIRDATARRARAILVAKNDPDSDDEIIASKAAIVEMSNDELIEYLVANQDNDLTAEAQRRVLDKSEWEDFEAFRDSVRQWEEAGYPEGEEWEAVERRDAIFGAQVAEELANLQEASREALNMLGRDQLEHKALEIRVDTLGNQAFMRAYQEQMLFYSCRDGDDHSLYFFENAKELLTMPEEVQKALADKLGSFINNPVDAKNSSRADRSSDLSVPPAEQETSAPSGQDGATE